MKIWILFLFLSIICFGIVKSDGTNQQGCGEEVAAVLSNNDDTEKERCQNLKHCMLDCATVLPYCKPKQEKFMFTKNPKFDTTIKQVILGDDESEAYTYTCVDKAFKKNPVKTFGKFLKDLKCDKAVKNELYLEAGYMAKFNQFCKKQKTEDLNLAERLELFKNGHKKYRQRIEKRNVLFCKRPDLEKLFDTYYAQMVRLFSQQGRCKCKNFYYFYKFRGLKAEYKKKRESLKKLCVKKFGEFCGELDDTPYKIWLEKKRQVKNLRKSKVKRRIVRRLTGQHWILDTKSYKSCESAANHCNSYTEFYHDFKSSCDIEKSKSACSQVNIYKKLKDKYCKTKFPSVCNPMAPLCRKMREKCNSMRKEAQKKVRACNNNQIKVNKIRKRLRKRKANFRCYRLMTGVNAFCRNFHSKQCFFFYESRREKRGVPLPKYRLFNSKLHHFVSGCKTYAKGGELNTAKCNLVKDKSACKLVPYYTKLLKEYQHHRDEYKKLYVEAYRVHICRYYKKKHGEFTKEMNSFKKHCTKECGRSGNVNRHKSYDCNQFRKFRRYATSYSKKINLWCSKTNYYAHLAKKEKARLAKLAKKKAQLEALKKKVVSFKSSKTKYSYNVRQQRQFWKYECGVVNKHNTRLRKEIGVLQTYIGFIRRKARKRIVEIYQKNRGNKAKIKELVAKCNTDLNKKVAHYSNKIREYTRHYRRMPRFRVFRKQRVSRKPVNKSYTVKKVRYRGCLRHGYKRVGHRRAYVCLRYGYRYKYVRVYKKGTQRRDSGKIRIRGSRQKFRYVYRYKYVCRRYTRIRYRGRLITRCISRTRRRVRVRITTNVRRVTRKPAKKRCARYKYSKSKCGKLQKTCIAFTYKKPAPRISPYLRKRCVSYSRSCRNYTKYAGRYTHYCANYTKLCFKYGIKSRYGRMKANACRYKSLYHSYKKRYCTYYTRVCRRFF